jgi:hypothetical protein
MRGKAMLVAATLAVGAALVATPRAQAQEMDQCYNVRWGRMGCVEVEGFNFADPVLGINSRYRMLGNYVTTPDMKTVRLPATGSQEQGQ